MNQKRFHSSSCSFTQCFKRLLLRQLVLSLTFRMAFLQNQWNVHLLSTHQQVLGEGPFYDDTTQRFYQVDILGKRVIRIDLKQQVANPSELVHEKRDLPDLVSFVIPFVHDPNLLLISLRNKLAVYHFEEDKILKVLDFSHLLKEHERFNDAKCDRQGRLFVGTMLQDNAGHIIPMLGDLYRLDGENLTRVAGKFTVANGMAWSADDRIFYFNDSDDQKIWKFDFSEQFGELTNPRVLIDVRKTNNEIKDTEYPDGMCIDAEDNLWISLWGGSRVVKLNTSTAKVEQSIYTGSNRTSSVCFGRLHNRDVLFVTSAHFGQEPDPNRSGRSFVLSSSEQIHALVKNNYFAGDHLLS